MKQWTRKERGAPGRDKLQSFGFVDAKETKKNLVFDYRRLGRHHKNHPIEDNSFRLALSLSRDGDECQVRTLLKSGVEDRNNFAKPL